MPNVVDDRPDIPQLPTGSIDVQPPPDVVQAQGPANILATVIPMMGSMGVMIFMAIGQGNQQSLLMGGGMIVAMLAMVGFNVYRQIGGHRKQVRESRREYLAYLADMRDVARAAAKRQREHSRWNRPEPSALVLIAAEGSRVWERHDPDSMLAARLGRATQELSMSLEEPQLPALANPDPVCFSAMHRFVAVHSSVDNLPFGTDLGTFSHVEVAGDPAAALAEVRALVLHLATFAPPSALRIAVLCAEDRRSEWEWVKWLPHVRSTEVSDALGPARIIVSDYADLADMLGEQVTSRNAFASRDPMTPWPHVLVILDGATLPAATRLGSAEGTAGVTVVSMPTAWEALTSRTTLRLIVHPVAADGVAAMEVVIMDNAPIVARADSVTVQHAEAVARRLTRWATDDKPKVEEAVGRPDPQRSMDLMDLLGVGDIRDFDPDRRWTRRTGRDRLRVPFGVTPEGIPVLIDIKESAQQGMGPHGLLIGATGSGKSEVLRTIVLALALTHSPEQLNFVLVDFKGGATFAGMADMPHVSAMISNLESELFLVDRMAEALRGEMVRRQELLRRAGNYANQTDYEADRIAGKHDCEPMAALFIILDEFSELLSAKPDFIDTFVAIGRLGRSLSIHLLLSSQRLEEGRLRGLDSHLSYRIGLRTFSAQESRSVLGVPDAYELPSVPGVGYLKAGQDSMTRFRASYVAAPPPARTSAAAAHPQAGAPTTAIEVLPFTSRMQISKKSLSPTPVAQPTAPSPIRPGDQQWADMTEMDIAVRRMAGHGGSAHQVWLPPLEIPATFDELMDDLATLPDLGLVSTAWRAKGPLRIPLGMIDLPLEQRRETLEIDLSGAGGNLAIVGGPMSGKSTAARSLVLALSLVCTPREVQFYILDFGGTFAAFDGAAHVAGVASRDDPDVMTRMVSEIEGIMEDRERYFRAHRIDAIGTYRAGRADGRFDDGYGDVFLVVDGWATLRADFSAIEERVGAIASRGLSLGVHLVLTTGRWPDIRPALRTVLGSTFELRLGDVTESTFGRRVAETVPDGHPGRGLEAGGHHALIALPRIDGDADPASIAQGVADALARIKDAWNGGAPKLRLLPEKIALDQLRADNPDIGQIILGIEESRLAPLVFDARTESHLFLFGDSKTGKSTFLRSLVHEITRCYTPKQAKILTVDVRRALLGEIPEEYKFGYFTTREEAGPNLAAVAEFLTTRLPSGDVTPEQLRNRSWWTGAEIWVLVDDYDLVATAGSNPIAALQPLMAQAQDVGFHVIITRRTGGAARAMYDPIIQAMNELGATGILLAGNPDEGQLIGRAKPMRTGPGRAQVVSRDAGRIVAQLAWTDPKL